MFYCTVISNKPNLLSYNCYDNPWTEKMDIDKHFEYITLFLATIPTHWIIIVFSAYENRLRFEDIKIF